MVKQLVRTGYSSEQVGTVYDKPVPGNFLQRNQYGLWFSDRCNYKCSYCCNNASPKAPKSEIESNPEALIYLFNQVEPGVILVSGGEPTLWKDFPDILNSLPQHYWVVLTNLTTIPEWLNHPNIKLLLPAYHEEFANEERFTAYLTQLKEMGKRAHVKLIVKPGQEYNQVPLWEKWNGLGIPTSFTPLEYTFRFKREFLKDVVDNFRTSSLYNSRFFRRQSPANRYCVAGTGKSFQVNSDGSLVRCSSIHEFCGDERAGSIWQPEFNREAKYCTAEDCFCEWHHWGQTALANDNSVWTDYIETGIWKNPSAEELCQFVLDMDWDLAGKNAEHSKQSIFHLNEFPEALQFRAKLQQTQIELERSQAEVLSAQLKLEHIQKEYQAEIQQAKQTLEQTQGELNKLREQILEMKSSGFWQLRLYWMKIKKIFKLTAEE